MVSSRMIKVSDLFNTADNTADKCGMYPVFGLAMFWSKNSELWDRIKWKIGSERREVGL